MTISAQPVIRVALVITELEVGGAERCLVRLACGLDRSRYAVEVYALGGRPNDESLAEQLETHNIPVHFLGARGWLSFRRMLKQLRTHVARQQPQVIQSFLFHSNVVVSYLPRGPWKIFFGMRVADPRNWRSMLERWRARRADRIVCVSQNVKDFLRRRHFPDEKLVVIPNGIDTHMFETASAMSLKHLGIADENPVILFLARLDPQKGVDWLLEAIQPMLAQRTDCHLVLAGKGDWSRYQHLAQQNADRILWLGWQANTAALLRRSKVLVLPSRWEGMPNVVLEAMAAGVPVLATDVEGVREVLGTAAEQQTVRFGDSDSFERKLLSLLDNNNLRSQLISANQSQVKSQFTVERMIAAYEQVWRSH